MRPATRRAGPLAILSIAALSMLPLGCTADPRVRFEGASMRDRTETGVVVDLRLLVDNPGPEPLPLREVRYTLSLNGRAVFSGVRSAQATVRRFGTQAISLPAAFVLPPGLTGPVPFQLSGTIEYIGPGVLSRALLDSDLVTPAAPFRASGTVDLSAPVATP